MDTGTIVGSPAENCTNCLYCTNLHEEDLILCGSCMEHGFEVWEFDQCSDWESKED